ncbi:MAG TPA: hypothetical protein VET89_02220 [Stellaceae bacterium]|jgi:hypothetical protein|nr:hypothetical protein [Stellaceae bacterium]
MRLIVAATALLLASASAMAADCTHPTVIQLAPGATSATVESGAPSEMVDCYQVTASAGQLMSVTIAGDDSDAVFAVFAPGWEASCSAIGDCDVTGDQLSVDEATTWSDAAPASGAYLIVIDNSRSDAEYKLTVAIR